jgi:hypothetical protein
VAILSSKPARPSGVRGPLNHLGEGLRLFFDQSLAVRGLMCGDYFFG